MISRNDPCWCGSQKKWKKCHYPQLSISNKKSVKDLYFEQFGILLKNERQIEEIRASCKLAASILNILCSEAKEGVTTNELDYLSSKLHRESGAIPAPLGYGTPPFPKTICTSLNEVVCHGIPNNRPLQRGDFLNIDVTCILNGYYGDCSRMVAIDEIDREKKTVMDVSYECLMRSIAICKPQLKVYQIGDLIEDYASAHNCSVVYQFVGHGVGVHFHEPPQIPHHQNQLQIPFVEGMTFTLEPMINAGVPEVVIDPIDQWTARTQDGKPSAQWEHTLLITQDGCEILTQV